jgi:uncharacterized protein (UPF0332 family)
MKEEDRLKLINYRLGRARETLKEALLMQREGHWNACVNRLYYACFHAVAALLATKGISSSNYRGVKSFFNRYWIITHKISKEHGQLYDILFRNRQESDYGDFVFFDRNTVETWFPQAIDFIENIVQLIEEEVRIGSPEWN